ncbi:hypothetical protein [Streptomyces sp. NPDC048665]|uniref:hypothetical protein n=1 Tax=Streptomyces sp. NPDC048665 TaxID=3155490 RepID=UPI003425E6FA
MRLRTPPAPAAAAAATSAPVVTPALVPAAPLALVVPPVPVPAPVLLPVVTPSASSSLTSSSAPSTSLPTSLTLTPAVTLAPPPVLPPLPRLALAAVTVAVAVGLLVPLSAPVARAVGAPADAVCAGADAHVFPLTARIRGGPDSYEAGGGFGTWYIDLTNTTRRTCTGVHPVVVLVDSRRALKPHQPRLDFYDGSRARPVSFESTDEQELVGVLDAAGFAGFTVPAGRTVSVRVRLSLTSDAVADRVTAGAAVVQRRGADDGDWVGQSDPYVFGIVHEGDRAGDGAEAGAEVDWRTSELARTGTGGAPGLSAAAGALVGAGAGAFLVSRRRR